MKFIAAAGLVLAAFVCLMMLLLRGIDADNARMEREHAEWLQFTAQHHCVIRKPATFFHLNDTWACDGFDVLHD